MLPPRAARRHLVAHPLLRAQIRCFEMRFLCLFFPSSERDGERARSHGSSGNRARFVVFWRIASSLLQLLVLVSARDDTRWPTLHLERRGTRFGCRIRCATCTRACCRGPRTRAATSSSRRRWPCAAARGRRVRRFQSQRAQQRRLPQRRRKHPRQSRQQRRVVTVLRPNWRRCSRESLNGTRCKPRRSDASSPPLLPPTRATLGPRLMAPTATAATTLLLRVPADRLLRVARSRSERSLIARAR